MVAAGKLLLAGGTLVRLDTGVGALVTGELIRPGKPAGEGKHGGPGLRCRTGRGR